MIDNIPTLDDVELKGKTVIVRVDLNSPTDPRTRKLTDISRIRSHIKTINELSEKGAKTVLLTHQGDPFDEFENFTLINKEVDNLLASLSRSEGEVLRHIADGNSLEQLAQTKGISEEALRNQLNLILTKLVSNEHNRDVIEAAQSHFPSVISKTKPGKIAEYITRDEFNTFRESLKERFKSFLGD